MILLEFKGFRSFRSSLNERVISRWLRIVGSRSKQAFRNGMNGPHTGRLYNRRGGSHRASSPDEFPATDSGKLIASIRDHSTNRSAVIGTNVPYSIYLRKGTSKMKRRRMSDEAILLGASRSEVESRGWAGWKRV